MRAYHYVNANFGRRCLYILCIMEASVLFDVIMFEMS